MKTVETSCLIVVFILINNNLIINSWNPIYKKYIKLKTIYILKPGRNFFSKVDLIIGKLK